MGDALKEIAFDAAFTSPLKRARETAELIVSRLETGASNPLTLQVSDDLKEISLPPWEGLSFQEVEEKFPEAYQLWRDDTHNLSFQMGTAEGEVAFFPLRSLFEQAERFWQQTLADHAGKTLLVVAHSAINRALISTAMGLEPQQFTRLYQANCGISILNFANGWGSPVQMESMNLTGHLGQPLPQTRRGQKGIRLLLVRHGETEWNRQGRFQGQIDVPLNDTGRRQAQQAAEFLSTIPIDQAVSSSMLRPKETAEIILQHHPDVTLTLKDGLREISHGLWEGKLEAEIEAAYPGELERWQATPAVVQMPEGENLQQVWDRATVAWDEIVAAATEANEPLTVMVVAHDAVNKAILCYVAGLGPEHFWHFKQGNGAVSVIDYPLGGGRPILRAMNITTHLGSVLDRTAAGAL